MGGARIVPFTRADLPFGKSLTEAEGWHRSVADWERLLALEPEGAFKAVLRGRDVGTAAVVAFDRVAWIHSVLVRQEERGKGIGGDLMRACVDFARRRGIPTTKLDSVEGVEPFYERFGFVREFPSWRFLRDGMRSSRKAARLRASDLEAVLAYDRERTGLDRRKALLAILRDDPEHAFAARDRGGVHGYVVVRSGEHRRPIGPCVADDGTTAETLLRAALAVDPAGKFRACVAGCNEPAVRLMKEVGFETESRSTRMFLGQPLEEAASAYVMVSAEKG